MAKKIKILISALSTILVCTAIIAIFFIYHIPSTQEQPSLNIGHENINLVESGKLRVAISPEYPPFEYMDKDQIKGIDADLAKLICKDMNLELSFESMPFDSVIDSVAEGKADIALSGIAITSERQQKVNFTNPYWSDQYSIVVKKNSKVNENNINEQLNNPNITCVCQAGTTCEEYSKNTYPYIKHMAEKNSDDCLKLLQQNKADIFIVNKSYAESKFTSKDTVFYSDDYKIISTLDVTEQFSIGVNKHNSNLLNTLNEILQKHAEDGTLNNFITNNL